MSSAGIKDAVEGAPAARPDWREGLAKTEAGTPRKNLHNACVALRDHPALEGKIAYDEFNGCTYVRGPLPWDDRPDRPWSEFDDLAATEWLQSGGVGIQVGSGIAREAVQRVAYENRFHPILEWLEGLRWDGTERLDGWLTTYLGTPRSPLSDAIGRKFLISAVARVMRPGCKVDHMLILEGPQGLLKSTALRTLVGDSWFADQIADLGTKDSCQDLRGKWLIELSELSAIRPGEVERIKAYVSRQVDHYRASYGRRSGDVPRQSVFVGTTNDAEYLSDPTGGRRFWPVACITIKVEDIARDRDQLWAEAVAAYHAGETWWLDDAELRQAAAAEQEQRRIADPWEGIIAAWLEEPTEVRDGIRVPIDLEDGRVNVGQILEHAIAKPAERQTKGDQMRVGKILRLLGWEKRKAGKANRVVWELSEVSRLSAGDSAPTGVSPSEVSRQGVSPENRSQGRVADRRDTADTLSAPVWATPCGSELQNPGRGVSGVSPPGNGAGEHVACAHCREPVEPGRPGITATDDGRYLHNRCVNEWARSTALLEERGRQAEPSDGRPFDDWEDAERDLTGEP